MLKKKENTEGKSWFRKLIGEGDDVSSKRVVGLVGSASLFGTMIANSFTHQEFAPSDNLVQAVLWVTIGSLGFTSLDKFRRK